MTRDYEPRTIRGPRASYDTWHEQALFMWHWQNGGPRRAHGTDAGWRYNWRTRTRVRRSGVVHASKQEEDF
jgi:hypothetical protein